LAINNNPLTVVNYFSKMLIIKNGIFFDLLKKCLHGNNHDKNNKILIFVLTQLTAYHHHYKRNLFKEFKNIIVLIRKTFVFTTFQ